MDFNSVLQEARDLLRNRKIVDVRWMPKKDRDELFWDESTLVLVLDDGNTWFCSADDEGNRPGQLWGTDSQSNALGFPNKP